MKPRDFKKNSLRENLDRIASKGRLDEDGMYLGVGFEKPEPVKETVARGADAILELVNQFGHETVLDELIRWLEDHDALKFVENFKRNHEMYDDEDDDIESDIDFGL